MHTTECIGTSLDGLAAPQSLTPPTQHHPLTSEQPYLSGDRGPGRYLEGWLYSH